MYWEDVADSYIVEFGGDYECCPPGSTTTNMQATYVINQNYFDLYTVAQNFNNKCFGWRVKAEHRGQWTEWCCVTTYTESGGWGTPVDNMLKIEAVNPAKIIVVTDIPVKSLYISKIRRMPEI